MSYQEGLCQWEHLVSSKLPHLSRPQALILAHWSYAMMFVGQSGMTMVGAWLAQLEGGTEGAWRQRLREWCDDAVDKKGDHRAQLEVADCFAPLLCWVLSYFPPQEQQIALALDATPLGQRFSVLCISVLARGGALPVAWQIQRAQEPGAWEPIWKDLLDQLADGLPADWRVVVMADRGLYAKWLYRDIQSHGWHPFLRISGWGKVREHGAESFEPLTSVVPGPGLSWAGQVECFADQKARLECTLVARWDEGHEQPWLLVTDLDASQAEGAWYAMRFWIACGFRGDKRGGWHWHQTKMTDPRRAERLWLVMAVATLWTMSVGGEAEREQPPRQYERLEDPHWARMPARGDSKKRRWLSCRNRGRIVVQVALLQARPLPKGQLGGEPWPETVSPPRHLPAPKQAAMTKALQALRERKRLERRRRRARKGKRVA
jgi:hypothetical protein